MRSGLRRRRERDPDRPVRVAQVCGTAEGALWMVQIALGLKRRGFDVVAIISGADGGTAATLGKIGIPFLALPQQLFSASRAATVIRRVPILGHLRKVLHALALIRNAARMARVLRSAEVDVVHTHAFHSMIIGRLAGAMARVPVRVTMVERPAHLEAALPRRLDLLTYRLQQRLLAGCQYTNDLYAQHGVPAAVRRTVGYGVDAAGYDPAAANRTRVRDELGIADETPLVGQVAFFHPPLTGYLAPPGMNGRGIKGHEDLMAAARLVLDQRPDVRFLVVGDGLSEIGQRHFEDIKRLARDLRIDHAVIFAGRRRDLTDVIAALDISVQCSLSENYGGTIESLLMERPMIATRAGGMPEVVIDGETGLLVPVRDPQALAAAILRLIDDPDYARVLGRAGRARVLERHTIQRTIDGVIDAYLEVARERSLRWPALDGAARDQRSAGFGLMPADVLFRDAG